jgi:hypothetical protein
VDATLVGRGRLPANLTVVDLEISRVGRPPKRVRGIHSNWNQMPLAALVKIGAKLRPRAVTAPMITRAISMTISAYSTAVAPRSGHRARSFTTQRVASRPNISFPFIRRLF